MSFEAKIIVALLTIIGLAAGALGIHHAGYVKGDRLRAQADQAAIDKQKAEAAATLADETAKVLARERDLADLRAQQEIKDGEHQKTVAGYEARLRAAAGPAGRLRDPNATADRCGPGGGGAPGARPGGPDDRAPDGAQVGGLLSAQLTGLLQRLTREADDINDAYASCRASLMAERP